MWQSPLATLILASVVLGGCPSRTGFYDPDSGPSGSDGSHNQTGDGDNGPAGDGDPGEVGDGDAAPGDNDETPVRAFRLQYDRTWIVLLRNAAMLPLAIESTREATYVVEPPLPAGLTLNPSTGAISGTPSALQAPFGTHTVTATADIGTSTTQLRIAVLDGFVVNTTNDLAPTGTLGDNICASAPGSCSIRAAVAEAAALTGTQIILVPAGLFPLSSLIQLGSDALVGSRDGASILDATSAGSALGIVSPDVGYMSDLEISGSQDPGGSGGCVEARGQLMASHLYVHDCLATTGGGIKVFNGGMLDIEASLFTDNRAEDCGGALAVTDTSSLSIHSTTFTDNTSDVRGGAVCIESAQLNTLRTSYLGDNTGASGGGGVYVSPGGQLLIETCTFEGNRATTTTGGAIMSEGAGLTISYSTFSGNLANGGGTVVSIPGGSSTTVMQGCFMFQSGVACTPGNANFASNGYNVFQGPIANCPELSAATDRVDAFLGAGFVGSAADNGGLTHTIAIPSDSDAADVGSLDCPALDQRGETRPQSFSTSNSCDAGAYEISISETF